MITVSAEQDRVILSFPQRGRVLQLSPDQADSLAESIERNAEFCKSWVESGGKSVLLKGESRGAKVKSWDGKVNVQFDSIVDRESIPYKGALCLAGEIRAKATEAAFAMTIQWQPQFLGV